MQRSKPVQMSGPVLKTLFLSQRITESVDTVEQTTREPLEGTSHQAGTVINVRVSVFGLFRIMLTNIIQLLIGIIV